MWKLEWEAANIQVLPHIDADVRPAAQVPDMTRKAELDARQRALEVREREQDATYHQLAVTTGTK